MFLSKYCVYIIVRKTTYFVRKLFCKISTFVRFEESGRQTVTTPSLFSQSLLLLVGQCNCNRDDGDFDDNFDDDIDDNFDDNFDDNVDENFDEKFDDNADDNFDDNHDGNFGDNVDDKNNCHCSASAPC